MKQSLTRKLHLAGGEGLGSRYGLDVNWNLGHPLRKAWSCKTNKQISRKLLSRNPLSQNQLTGEKTRRS